jgi:hypothetical protein
MTYILCDATDTVAVTYPYSVRQLITDNPNTSFEVVITPATLAQFHVFLVTEVVAPVVVASAQYVIEATPVRVGSTWTQTWTVLDYATEVIAQKLALVRSDIWIAVKALRTSRILDGGVIVAGTDWYHTDIVSRSQYQQLLTKARDLTASGSPDTTTLTTAQGPVYWKLMDNRFVPMTIARIRLVVAAIEDQEAFTFAYGEALRAAVYASNDPASININAGWPVIYGE